MSEFPVHEVVITLEGKPGVGKTIIAEYIATMLGMAGFGHVRVVDEYGPQETRPRGHLIGCVANRNVVIKTKLPKRRSRRART